MQISKSRLKQIVKEELIRVEENRLVEQEHSLIDEASYLITKLEKHIPKNDSIGIKIWGDLLGIITQLSESEEEY